jgi:hypothetical protein
MFFYMKKSILLLLAGPVILLFNTGCSKSNDVPAAPPVVPPVNETDTTPSAKYDITKLDYTVLFEATPVVNKMLRQDYNELSGVAASKVNAGVLYVHDDNANSAIVITNQKGDDLGRIILDNTQTVNPEDISVGPGPDPTKSYIYLADIGDNNSNRSSIAVYRFPEPVISSPSAQTEIHITAADKIQLKYPSPVNAETILVDPLTKDVFIASKENSKATLYMAPYPQSTSTAITLKPVAKMPFDLLTSGDISPDGTEVLLRNKGQIWYWKRQAGQTITQTILNLPQKAPYSGNEHQGEGICFAVDGSGFITDTEIRDYPGTISNISFYKRK